MSALKPSALVTCKFYKNNIGKAEAITLVAFNFTLDI